MSSIPPRPAPCAVQPAESLLLLLPCTRTCTWLVHWLQGGLPVCARSRRGGARDGAGSMHASTSVRSGGRQATRQDCSTQTDTQPLASARRVHTCTARLAPLTRRHFQHSAADGPNVCRDAVALLLDDLRSHPERAALERLGVRHLPGRRQYSSSTRGQSAWRAAAAQVCVHMVESEPTRSNMSG